MTENEKINNDKNGEKSINSHVPEYIHSALKKYCETKKVSFRAAIREALIMFLKVKLKEYKLVRIANETKEDELKRALLEIENIIVEYSEKNNN